MSEQAPPIILVDGSSYLYRAFHVPQLQRLTNSKGEMTGAVYGVINMLRKLKDEYQPEYMAVVFDARGKTFRHDMYKEYKATRPPMPDDLRNQIEPLHQLVKALGFKLISVPGVEADDVIGTLAQQASKNKKDMLVSTGDKDMAQLVSEHVTLINTMSNTRMDESGVEEKFGVKPEQIIDYLALMGDTSDNIPGVPKVGPKTAAKWLVQYETLDNIIEHADEFKGKVGEHLRGALDQLPLSRELTTIKCDLDLEDSIEDLKLAEPDRETLEKIYTEMEFRSWLDELAGGAENKQRAAKKEASYETVLDKKSFDKWLKKLKKAKRFAFDTETTSLNYMQARIVGVSFAVEAGEAAYVPFGHDYPDAPKQLDENTVLGGLKPLLEDGKVEKIGQNLKYDAHVLENHGITMQGIAEDTMLESYVLDSTRRHDMDSMALRVLGINTIHFEDVAGKGAKQLTFNEVALEQAGPYAAEDADITLQLHQKLSEELKAQPTLLKIYHDIELPLLPVLRGIERNGVKVDVAMLKKQSGQLAKRMVEVEKESFDAAGETFNLASPKQIQAILFEKLELPVIRKTPKGQPSTAEDVLQELANDYELPKLILEHRSLSKLKSTYTDKLPLQVNEKTGRVHTSYNQTVAATGRLSSTDPNLQNIPIRSEEGRRIRQAFIAEKGNCLVAADYSQIELRIMAHLSQDEGLLTAFADGIDVHRATAAEVFGVDLESVENEQRRAAKAINFGLIYGMSAFGLAKQLNIGRYEAQDYVDLYFERYPGVKQYMDITREKAHDQGYVETVFGRRLYLPEINARNKQRQQYAERTAINAPMQGTAADIIKRAMINVDVALAKSDLDARVVMQVHDELVVEVAKKQADDLSKLLTVNMENAAELSVALVVDIGQGSNWDEAH
jgi:DNA polymerase-1